MIRVEIPGREVQHVATLAEVRQLVDGRCVTVAFAARGDEQTVVGWLDDEFDFVGSAMVDVILVTPLREADARLANCSMVRVGMITSVTVMGDMGERVAVDALSGGETVTYVSHMNGKHVTATVVGVAKNEDNEYVVTVRRKGGKVTTLRAITGNVALPVAVEVPQWD